MWFILPSLHFSVDRKLHMKERGALSGYKRAPEIQIEYERIDGAIRRALMKSRSTNILKFKPKMQVGD